MRNYNDSGSPPYWLSLRTMGMPQLREDNNQVERLTLYISVEMTTLQELTKGLSPVQKEAFIKLLKSTKPLSSYSLSVRISTMHSLEKKGLVRGKWSGAPVLAETNYLWEYLWEATYKIKGR